MFMDHRARAETKTAARVRHIDPIGQVSRRSVETARYLVEIPLVFNFYIDRNAIQISVITAEWFADITWPVELHIDQRIVTEFFLELELAEPVVVAVLFYAPQVHTRCDREPGRAPGGGLRSSNLCFDVISTIRSLLRRQSLFKKSGCLLQNNVKQKCQDPRQQIELDKCCPNRKPGAWLFFTCRKLDTLHKVTLEEEKDEDYWGRHDHGISS